MDNWFSRTELLLGQKTLQTLKHQHILVVGVGGVGAYAAEMLCRAGIGQLTIVDADTVQPSNINRQLIALHSTVNKSKVEILKHRLLDINPQLKITALQQFICDEETDVLLSNPYDYVVDAIDTLAPKVNLIKKTLVRNYPLVSAMGAGAKSDPAKIRIADISKSHTCYLAYALRKRLHKMGIYSGFQVVFSEEKPEDKAIVAVDDQQNKKSMVGTISYMPAIFGCMAASVVLRYYMNQP